MAMLIPSIITLVLVLGIASSYLCSVSRAKRNASNEYLQNPRHLARTGIMIICGNCSGDAIAPYKTFMTVNGCCDSCGSTSYVLAGLRAFQHQTVRGYRLRAITTAPRILSFDRRRTA